MTDKKLVGGLVVTHGKLGHELLAATEMIVGPVRHILPVSIGWNDDVEASKGRIEECIRQVEEGKGVILLTDMFGGTPSNIALSFHRKGRLEIITGVNLPMLIKLASQRGDETLEELALQVKEQGKRQISIAGELLQK